MAYLQFIHATYFVCIFHIYTHVSYIHKNLHRKICHFITSMQYKRIVWTYPWHTTYKISGGNIYAKSNNPSTSIPLFIYIQGRVKNYPFNVAIHGVRRVGKSVTTNAFTTMAVAFRVVLLLAVHLQTFSRPLYHRNGRLYCPWLAINYKVSGWKGHWR